MANTWQHAANAYAEALVNALQDVRNIRDGIISCNDVIARIAASAQSCRAQLPDPTAAILATPAKHGHYFKPSPFDHIDVYRVLQLFGVSDPCLQHATKKLLVPGGRAGGKSIDKDIQEAIDTLTRWQAMAQEDRDAEEKG